MTTDRFISAKFDEAYRHRHEDPEAFGKTLLRLCVYSLAAIRIRNHHDREDMVQDLVMHLLRNIHTYREDGGSRPSTYFRRIVLNKLFSNCKHRRVMREREREILEFKRYQCRTAEPTRNIAACTN